MEPGPTERHESDTAAAPNPAGGSVASGGPVAPAASGGATAPVTPAAPGGGGAGDGAAPRPRTRRGWMSDAPLDGGSGWPTSAYAIIKRPDNYDSANGSAPTSPPNGAVPIVPAPPPMAAVEPGEETRTGSRIKLPRQKSWLRGRGWGNRSAAAADSIADATATEATVNLQAAAANATTTRLATTGHTAVAAPPTTDARVVDPAVRAPDSIDTADTAPLAPGAETSAPTTDTETATPTIDAGSAVLRAGANTTARAAGANLTALTTDGGTTALTTAVDTTMRADDANPTALTTDAVDTADTTRLTAGSITASALAGGAVDTAPPTGPTEAAETVPIDRERAALDLQAAEAIHDLREAMRSLRRPEDGVAARGTAAVTAGPPPEDAEPDDPTEHNEPVPTDEAGTPRGLAIAAAVIILIALALVVYFAIRANGPSTDQTDSATIGAAGAVEPETSTAVSFAPEGSSERSSGGSPGGSATPNASAAAEGGDVLRSGSVRLAIGTNQADESFDFDSGIKGAPNAFTGGQRPDLDALTQGLWAANGAHVAVWTKTGSPTAAGCRGLPDGDWTSLIKVEPALAGPKVCVQTSEGRAATFVARPIDVGPDGGVETVYLDFTVWKKAGD